MPSREELERIMARPVPDPPIKKRFHYKQAFIMSPKLSARIVQVERISDGIAIIEALGEGKLLVSTQKSTPSKGYFEMAECTLEELRGKSEQEIFDILDRRTDQLQRSRRKG